MKKNYTKLTIKNKQVILNEATKYGSGGIGKKLLKIFTDALKVTGLTIKRAWGSTFVLGWNVGVALAKGDLEEIKNINERFKSSDAALANQVKSIISAQPGSEDLNVAMSAFSGGATNVVEKYLETDLSGPMKALRKIKTDIVPSKKDVYESNVAYANIVMSISNLSHNTPVTFAKEKYSKKKRKKISITKAALDNVKTKKFIIMCKLLQKFYVKEGEDKAEKTFFIGKDVYDVLEMFIKKSSKNKIVKYISDQNVSYNINSAAKSFLNNEVRKAKIKNDFAVALSNPKTLQTDAKIILNNNKIIFENNTVSSLLLEEEENETKSTESSEDFDRKKIASILTLIEKSVITIEYLFAYHSYVSQNIKFILQNQESIIKTSGQKQDSMPQEEKNKVEDIKKDLLEKIKKHNVKAEKMRQFDASIKNKNEKDVENISKESEKYLKLCKERFEENQKKDIPEEIKNEVNDILYANIQLDVFDNIKDKIKEISIEESQQKYSESKQIIDDTLKKLESKGIKDIYDLSKSILSSSGISDFSETKSNINASHGIILDQFNEALSIYNSLNNIINQDEEMKKIIEEKQKVVSDFYETNQSGEVSEENSFIENQFLKSEIVKLESK